MSLFRRWMKRDKNEYSLRSLVEGFYEKKGLTLPVKNLEVRVAVADENIPRAIGTGGFVAKELKAKLGCDYLKVVPVPKPGRPAVSEGEIISEYDIFYRERRGKEHKRWTEEEEEKLISLWKLGMNLGKIAGLLERTPYSITCRLEKLGLSGNNPGSFLLFLH